MANHPVINVFWFDALAFCRWPGACPGLDAGQVVRLPAEWEWQWVSQVGRAAHAYPLGNESNSRDSGTGRTTAIVLRRYAAHSVQRGSVTVLSGAAPSSSMGEPQHTRKPR